MRTFAEDTEVPVGRSREEIRKMLIAWDAESIAWEDEIRSGRSILRFRWTWKGVGVAARFEVRTDSLEEIAKSRPRNARTPPVEWASKVRAQQERALHRLLALKLKGDLNAVQAGMLTAFQVFLPFLETADGTTFAQLCEADPVRMLGGGP